MQTKEMVCVIQQQLDSKRVRSEMSHEDDMQLAASLQARADRDQEAHESREQVMA